jgi:hypothetical protein
MSNMTRLRRQHPDIPDGQPICSRCGDINDRPPQRYCSGCHAGYQRVWRSTRVSVPRGANVSRDPEAEYLAAAVASLEGSQA